MSKKNGTKKRKIDTLLTFSTKQCKILPKNYQRQDFFYTNIVCTFIHFCISGSYLHYCFLTFQAFMDAAQVLFSEGEVNFLHIPFYFLVGFDLYLLCGAMLCSLSLNTLKILIFSSSLYHSKTSRSHFNLENLLHNFTYMFYISHLMYGKSLLLQK